MKVGHGKDQDVQECQRSCTLVSQLVLELQNLVDGDFENHKGVGDGLPRRGYDVRYPSLLTAERHGAGAGGGSPSLVSSWADPSAGDVRRSKCGDEIAWLALRAGRRLQGQRSRQRCCEFLDCLGRLDFSDRVALLDLLAVLSEPAQKNIGQVVVVELRDFDRCWIFLCHPGPRVGGRRFYVIGLRGGARPGVSGQQRSERLAYGVCLHQYLPLEVRSRRYDALSRADQPHWARQLPPQSLVNMLGDLRAPRAAGSALLGDADRIGVGEQPVNRVQFQRKQLRRHQDVDAYTVLEHQGPRRLQRSANRSARRDEHDVRAGSRLRSDGRPGIAAAQEIKGENVFEPSPAASSFAVEGLGLEEHPWLPSVEHAAHHPEWIVKRRQLMQRKMRDAYEMLLDALAVRWSISTIAANRATQHHVHRKASPIHADRLRGEIKYLIESEPGKISEHNLNDYSAPSQGDTVRDPNDAVLTQRGREHAIRISAGELAGYSKRAPVRIGNVFAKQIEGVIIRHEVGQGLIETVGNPVAARHLCDRPSGQRPHSYGTDDLCQSFFLPLGSSLNAFGHRSCIQS